jgi:hypothetical protein
VWFVFLGESFVVEERVRVPGHVFRAADLTLGRFPEEGFGARLKIREMARQYFFLGKEPFTRRAKNRSNFDDGVGNFPNKVRNFPSSVRNFTNSVRKFPKLGTFLTK